ncbi:hypothetical protein VIBNIPon4_700062 [Vibrio nigripulchritudo POn4]|nr:hypothetical protein VIBNIPon4_700062 [Vibrio nigripulchritudo POn4]
MVNIANVISYKSTINNAEIIGKNHSVNIFSYFGLRMIIISASSILIFFHY